MFRKISFVLAFVFMAITLFGSSASAYTLNSDGSGFVGKGEVQTAFGWNNKQLQANADLVSFEYESVAVTEVSWTCTNTKNETIQERERTTTTTTSGVYDATARDGRSQVTGFNLIGFIAAGEPVISAEGNPLNSCPTNWILDPAGDPVEVSNTGDLYAVFNGQRVLLPVLVA